MAPSFDFFGWWAKETGKGTPVEIDCLDAAFGQVDKDKREERQAI